MQTADEKEKEPTEGKSPYLSKKVYDNYARAMDKKNKERARKGLKAIDVRTYREWSGQ